MNKVSVIIPVFNYDRYIVRAVDSVLNQDYDDYEIIIIDDGSTDRTEEILRSKYLDKVQYYYQENKGPSAARNEGFRRSTGDRVIFLDGDDALAESQIRKCEEVAQEHPDHIIYCSWIRYVEKDGKHEICFIREDLKNKDMLEEWIKGWFIACCCIYWPREVVLSIGGWDENFVVGEDGEIAMRALIKGYKFKHCKNVYASVYSHTIETPSMSDTVSDQTLFSRLAVNKKVESMLLHKGDLKRYKTAISEYYYKLALNNALTYPEYAKTCYKEFRRLNRIGKPPGSVLNWIFILLFGIVRKQKLSYWIHTLVRRKMRK